MGVEVWMCRLPEVEAELPRLAALLSPGEVARASSCRTEAVRKRFLAGRGLLRALLSERLNVRPEAVRFTYSASGKPRLAQKMGEKAIGFNLSHSWELLTIALTDVPGAEVGVDVEWTGAERAHDGLVARFGTPKERAVFAALSSKERPMAFYRWWTRKEAAVKGAGATLGSALGLIEVPFDSSPVCEVELPAGTSPSRRAGEAWRVYTWEIDGAYLASLAVPMGAGFGERLRFGGGRHPALPLQLAAVLAPEEPFHQAAVEE